jgi:hypothetical protein
MPKLSRRQALLGCAAALVSGSSFPAGASPDQSPIMGRIIDPETIPRRENMDGSSLRIVSDYTEAGWFGETNCITVTDGERTAIYVPLRPVSR